MRPLRTALLLAIATAAAACGDSNDRARLPADAPAFLAWVRDAADADDAAELRRRLALWPIDDEAFAEADATQVALTWRVRVALEDGSVEAALEDVQRLAALFDGGRTPEGARLSVPLLRLGVADAAIERAVTAPLGDPDALAAVDRVAAFADPERLAAARRWLALPPPGRTGPAVIAWVDAFALGEPILSSVLRRWARDHADHGLEVVVVPTRLDAVRSGIRRVPASPVEVRSALADRAASLGVTLDSPFAPADPRAALLRALDRDVAVLVVDRKGRVVARTAGRGVIDPRRLEDAVQRVATR